eukprot:1408988-Prymnesium_polylepis.1
MLPPTQPQKALPLVTPNVVRKPCALSLEHTANDDANPRRQLSSYEARGSPNVQMITTPCDTTRAVSARWARGGRAVGRRGRAVGRGVHSRSAAWRTGVRTGVRGW